jgi:hypothetical protein
MKMTQPLVLDDKTKMQIGRLRDIYAKRDALRDNFLKMDIPSVSMVFDENGKPVIAISFSEEKELQLTFIDEGSRKMTLAEARDFLEFKARKMTGLKVDW